MSLHKPSGRWQLGLALSLTTALVWGSLPFALKIVLQQVDAATLTWFRFLVAGIFTAALLAAQGRLGVFRIVRAGHATKVLLALATLGLAGNYFFFQRGLRDIGAGTAQVLIQISPMMFLLGAVVIFKERLVRAQVIGLGLLVVGLVLFFSNKFGQNAPQESDLYWIGLGCIVIAGITWAIYALAQKQLLAVLPSPAVMMIIYFGSALLVTPVIDIQRLSTLDTLHTAMLGYTALNTIIAYGAFSEALAHWEGSRVSAVLAVVPVLTLGFSEIGEHLWPEYIKSEMLPPLSYAGAALVVAGSMISSLAQSRRKL